MQPEISSGDLWTTAQQKCWSHVEVATTMTKILDVLKPVRVASVIPILSDSRPTLMLTPDNPGDIVAVKATVRLISKLLQDSDLLPPLAEWQKMPLGDEWMLRCATPTGINIDVMTRLAATKESPIEV